MDERAGKSAQFDDVVCDVAVPAQARQVRVGERALPAPAHDPRTIVVLGDTGCRIDTLTAQAWAPAPPGAGASAARAVTIAAGGSASSTAHAAVAGADRGCVLIV
jgi:hypothetical protein